MKNKHFFIEPIEIFLFCMGNIIIAMVVNYLAIHAVLADTARIVMKDILITFAIGNLIYAFLFYRYLFSQIDSLKMRLCKCFIYDEPKKIISEAAKKGVVRYLDYRLADRIEKRISKKYQKTRDAERKAQLLNELKSI